ncbi:type II secretion system protein [Luteolibacter luteus]|uniref:Prepilin-type N-terminal cleavage/methylation domain-containing protein n=1 Tax=Luteolibacter luteus TaxID=2728835 RepID=A0A858RKU0_9BACT|nr:prepilin-type N-terminal cleavage/methylation domain-containing protein [Luteolibacter luteus]QJE96643.1 prepilin-type N-terminal cleavage/methylation domain-containing protein [Luteolibacter luteus]
MKAATPMRSSKRKGFSLLELTVVIAVLLSLTTILILGARAWKNGADRTACLMNIRNVQLAVRSYQNLYGYTAGGMPYAEGGSQDIGTHLFAKGYIDLQTYGEIHGTSPCAGGGLYECAQPDVFPMEGRLYISCSLESQDNHSLPPAADW